MELAPGADVLEIGCGTGMNFPLLEAEVGPTGKIIGVDISEEAFSDKELTVIDNSEFLNGLNYKEATAMGSPVKSTTMVWKFSNISKRPCEISAW